MVIDSKGMSHKPKGLPRRVAGTYEGLAATAGDDDLDTGGPAAARGQWATRPPLPGSNRRTVTGPAGGIRHQDGDDPTPVMDAAGALHAQTGLIVDVDMTHPRGIITLTDGRDTYTIGRQGRILLRRHGDDERHEHDYATGRTIDDTKPDWTADTDPNLNRMLHDMPTHWRRPIMRLIHTIEHEEARP